MRRVISIIAFISLVWVIGCGEEKPSDLLLARQELDTGLYSKAQIRLEQFIQKQPQNLEAQCLLTAAYNRQGKTQNLEALAGKLREVGKPAMDKLVSIMYETNMAEDMAETLVLAGEQAVDPVVSILGDPNESIRENAVLILTKIGIPAVKRLTEALESPDTFARVGAVKALGNIGDKTAMEPLKKRLEDGSPHVKIEAASALYKLGDKSHVGVIADGLIIDLISARRAAAAAMENVVEEPPLGPVLKATNDADTQVKASAIQALGKIKSAQSIDPLMEAMRSKNDVIRNAAAEGLKKAGELAVMPLVKLVGYEKDEGTLYRAVQILGDIGDKRAVEALEKVYSEDSRPLVKQEAAKALNKIE